MTLVKTSLKLTIDWVMLSKIYVIDDDPIFVLIASKLVQRHIPHVKLVSFDNGKLALEHLLSLPVEEQPDWIFLDINMPVMNGWEFLEEIEAHSLEQKFRLCMVSSSIDPVDLSKAESCKRISKFLNKPIKSNEMEDILRS